MPLLPPDAVRDFLRDEGISGCTVTAALSGGADSVCLLYSLLACAGALDLTVRAVHVQHGLRGEESLRDENFCRTLCASLHVPLSVETADVHGYMTEHACSEETAARECRYAVFDRIPGFVATAHNADDNLETLLFRIARGTGLKGLCGIPPRRGNLLRPFLTCTREEIEAFLAAQHYEYITDSTNLTDGCSRNILRHHAMPAMRTVNPAASRKASELCTILREEEAFLETLTDRCYAESLQPDGSLTGLGAQPEVLQRRCIARFFAEHGLPGGYGSICAVQKLLQTGGRFDPDRSGRMIVCRRGTLFVQETTEETSVRLEIGENVIFPGHTVTASVITAEEFRNLARFHKKFTFFALDYAIIKKYAELHGRRPGLFLRTPGRQHRVSVKKWLNETVSPAQRPYIHYLSDAEGLLWVEGLGAADRAAVTENTQQVLLLNVSHENDTKCIQD